MLWLTAGIMGGLGLASILSRRSLLGVMIGVQLLVMGAAMTFVVAGIFSGSRTEGYVMGLMVILAGVAQLVGGYSVAVRFFYLKGQTKMEELRMLKQ